MEPPRVALLGTRRLREIPRGFRTRPRPESEPLRCDAGYWRLPFAIGGRCRSLPLPACRLKSNPVRRRHPPFARSLRRTFANFSLPSQKAQNPRRDLATQNRCVGGRIVSFCCAPDFLL